MIGLSIHSVMLRHIMCHTNPYIIYIHRLAGADVSGCFHFLLLGDYDAIATVLNRANSRTQQPRIASAWLVTGRELSSWELSKSLSKP